MFKLIAGPCAIESEEMAMDIAEKMKAITDKLGIDYTFKGSFDKANRTSFHIKRGLGIDEWLRILQKVKATYNIPVATDIHESWQAEPVGKVVDIVQIPAFLCRQTDLLVAAAKTNKVVNVKKGQFLSAGSMKFAVDKIVESGNEKVFLTDRGNTFGYQDLIVDYRGIPEMRAFNVPTVMDCTHSLQQPNQTSGVTGGKPALIETIAKAAIAVGADGLFIETHPDPANAKSDGANMLHLDLLEGLMEKLVRVRQAIL